MQNLRKNKNKVITTQMMNLTNEEAIDTETCDEMNRGCKGKPNNMYNNNSRYLFHLVDVARDRKGIIANKDCHAFVFTLF